MFIKVIFYIAIIIHGDYIMNIKMLFLNDNSKNDLIYDYN